MENKTNPQPATQIHWVIHNIICSNKNEDCPMESYKCTRTNLHIFRTYNLRWGDLRPLVWKNFLFLQNDLDQEDFFLQIVKRSY